VSRSSDRFETLALKGVGHQFRAGGELVPTIAGVDLEVGRSEFVTVVGPSGCGKSTLFNLAAGLLRPTAGQVKVNGEPLEGTNPYVAYMFQQAALLEWRDVLGNVVLGQEFLGMPKGEARAAAMEGLAEFGLSGFERRRAWELSGGMRQRVALLRTYLTQRELLLLDEPFGALDALTRLQMQQFLLDRWQRDQRTVIFITHDVDEALLLGDRVIVLAPRPTYVLATVEVGFERPRNAEEVLRAPEFTELKTQMLEMLVVDSESEVEPDGSANGSGPGRPAEAERSARQDAGSGE